ncbi:hypothetical protein U5922_002470 [Aquicoccus sp. G2-2]|uniref:hypothetical protein n=1 Tax=Aquicoccus sp. G2-2 TaxID=3092120 RepID=UPI002AE086EA|nr:hypothetical protein [Aquicoccus sp. G2-2]MEA1112386.1 hypothetical protein [Aquicoccus sp. G2-2]
MKLLIAALALVAAGPALADPVCEMRGAEPLPVFETAKAAFLKGDFSAFLGSATVLMRGERAALEAPLAKLADLVPSGFDSCQTILQRRDIGGLVQEVTTFDIPGKSFPISLYLQAAPVKGAMGITSLSYNSKLDTVLNELH